MRFPRSACWVSSQSPSYALPTLFEPALTIICFRSLQVPVIVDCKQLSSYDALRPETSRNRQRDPQIHKMAKALTPRPMSCCYWPRKSPTGSGNGFWSSPTVMVGLLTSKTLDRLLAEFGQG